MTRDKLLSELTRVRVDLAAAKLDLSQVRKHCDYRGRVVPVPQLPAGTAPGDDQDQDQGGA